MKNSSTERSKLRNSLLSNGYIPLPLAAKGIFIKGWSRAEITEEWLDQYARVGRYPNTGLRCDNLVAFDIDVLDRDLADACEDYVEEQCGETDLCRVGQWPKRLLVYRLAHLDRAVIRSGRTGNYGGHMCELLATHGRQFAAFGIHPGTKKPYTWDAGTPADTPFEDLPEIDADKAMAVLEGLDQLLEATGMEKVRHAHMRSTTHANEYDLLPDTEVMVGDEILTWAELAPTLTTDGEFGNLYREDQNEWGDSSAVHFFLAHGSGEPCAHDFVNDCTHWESTWQPAFGQLLPPPPAKKKDNQFVHPDMADLIDNCVILRDKTVRRLSHPLRAYPLDGFVRSMQHLQVQDPNPPRSNPNKLIPFTKLWEMSPETLKADHAAMRPDYPNDAILSIDGERILNTYRAPQHVAGNGSTATFYEFLVHLLPADNDRKIFYDWLAHKVRFPGHRMHGMVMVTRAFGTGRGTLTQIMQRLFGPQYVNNIELHDLIGTTGQAAYNELLADSLILSVPEAYEENEEQSKWATRHAAYERIKTVCDPVSQPMHIKRKYGRNGVEQIYASLFISSNHIDALAIEPGDRRLIVLDNGDTPLVNAPNSLYERIQSWKDDPANIAELFAELSEHASDYDAFGEPPMTPAKKRMVEEGQSDTDRLFEIFTEQCEGDIVTPGQWRAFAHASRLTYDLDLPSDPRRREFALTAVLQKYGRRLDQMPSSGIKLNGKPHRPWVIRNFSDWAGTESWDEVRAEILRNGDPGGSNVVEMFSPE